MDSMQVLYLACSLCLSDKAWPLSSLFVTISVATIVLADVQCYMSTAHEDQSGKIHREADCLSIFYFYFQNERFRKELDCIACFHKLLVQLVVGLPRELKWHALGCMGDVY